MTTKSRISNAEHLGHRYGRMWRGYVRRERRVAGWLVGHGLPAGVATALLWIVKLAVLGFLLYVAFWIVLLLVFGVLVARAAGSTGRSDQDQEAEWRMGLSGYGLYRGDTRVDPGNPDDDD